MARLSVDAICPSGSLIAASTRMRNVPSVAKSSVNALAARPPFGMRMASEATKLATRLRRGAFMGRSVAQLGRVRKRGGDGSASGMEGGEMFFEASC